MGIPRILSVCVVTYTLICQHNCEDYGRSLCPLFGDSEPEQCGGGQELEATHFTNTLIGKPESQDVKPRYFRTCLWIIKSSNGSSIAIRVTSLSSAFEGRCQLSALTIYEGNSVTDPERTVFSKCGNDSMEKLHTGWNQLTISLNTYEGFLGSQFILEYNSYSTEDQSPVIRLSFDPFLKCSNGDPMDEAEPTIIFTRFKKKFAEVLIYFCVFPMENLTSVALKAPSNEHARQWKTQCNQTVCMLTTRDLDPPLSGNYTFVTAIRRSRAKARFQIFLKNNTRVVTFNSAGGLTYQKGKSYRFYCDFLGEPIPDASWYFYPVEHIYSCNVEMWELVKNRTIQTMKLLDNENNSRFKQEDIFFQCNHRDFRLSVDLVAETSGCLLCSVSNVHSENIVFESLPVSEKETDFFVISSDKETLVDEPFSMSCTANTFNYYLLAWRFEPKSGRKQVEEYVLEKEYNVTFKGSEDNWAVTNTINFPKLSLMHEGLYVCTATKATLKENMQRLEKVSSSKTLTVISVPAFIGKSYLVTNDQVFMAVQEGSDVTLNCSARGMGPLTYTWLKVMPDGLSIQTEGFDPDSSTNGLIVLKNASRHEGNKFSCTVANEAGKISRVFQLQFTQVISVPAFIGKSDLVTNDHIFMAVQEGSDVTLNCSARGMGPFNYTWSKVMPDGLSILIEGLESDSSTNGVIVLKNARRHEGNKFSCTAANEAGKISRVFQLQFTQEDVGEPGVWNDTAVAVTSAAVVFIVILTVVAILRWRWRKKKHEQAKPRIIPQARICRPSEVSIPFDVYWEFPEQRLTLEEKIGQGAYGKVVKAQAYGICPHESVTTVAVKMLKAHADSLQKKALFAELKILTRLGKHSNVVNLLGAVTKFQSTGRLYIIVEYCEKGSIYKYLLKQRKHFICQVHKETGKLDKKLCSYPFLKKNKECTVQQLDEGISGSQGTSSRSPENSNVDSAKTLDTGISTSSFTVPPSLISLDSDTEPPLTTMELIKYSFQCARGMEYISSRKLIHRDLSSRNVLLTKDNIIKICDFGLTRDEIYLYNDQKKVALPVKWMAPESLGQNQFNTKTDVWSFGIFLWEMFTLGDTPYPGMPVDESFYKKIFSGYRLTPPETSPLEISKLMTDCWKEVSEDRPNFSEILEILDDFLDDQTKNYYLSLDEPYEVMRKVKEPADEYLNMDDQVLLDWLFDVLPDMEEAPDDESTFL